MNKICWLHLSDWHQKGSKLEEDRKFVRDRLVEDIEGRRNLNSELGGLDFVVFSGDLAFSGRPEEYETAGAEFLDPVLRAAGVDQSKLFMVPGNHDLNRDKLRYLTSFLTLLPNGERVTEELSNPGTRANFLAPMSAYANFCTQYLRGAAPPEPAYSQIRRFRAAGRSVGILGLNSAWMCGQKRDGDGINDYGHLILGETQLNQHFDEWKKADVRLAVLHHPFEWFSTVEDRARLRRSITRTCHFLLRGHEHDPEVTVPGAGTAGRFAQFSAGAAYDRRENNFRPNGYNFVYLDFDQGQGTVYLRRYDSEQRKFMSDSSVTGDETPGITSFVLPGELKKPDTKRASADNNSARSRIMIGDLWAVQNPTTMQSIGEVYRAQHEQSWLKRNSATLVFQANSLRNEREPDLITLEQVFEPLEEPIYCIKLSMFSSPGDFLGQSKWNVVDLSTNKSIKTIALPTYAFREVAAAEEDPSPRALVIHFDPVLRVGTGPYKFEYREWVRDGMSKLRSGNVDELFVSLSRSREPIPTISLILKVPETFGRVQMQPSRLTSADNPGTALDESEVKCYDDLPGFYPLGWRGQNVPSDQIFGVDLVRVRDRIKA